MMFGYSDDWTVIIYALMLFWLPFGPVVMAVLGVVCARAGGRARRVGFLCSAVVPGVAVGVPAVAMFKPDDVPAESGDVLSFVGVYVLLLTVLPWAGAYGVARWRATRAARKAGTDGRQRQP
ncbi:hypothetical protein ACFOWE_11510 [Planomonospora corallina]|uniref:Uncharacterized protein n=1 Tax=Planomonospora corallina TaxID=1806052 RepID=A0ABV8I3Z2_9ACTN